jgi:hypothetical protein
MFTRSAPAFSFGLQELPVCRRVARIESGNPLCCESRLPHFHAATRAASLSPCSPDRIRESALLRGTTAPAFSCGLQVFMRLQELPVCRRVARIESGNPLCCESRLPHFHAATRAASLSPCSPDRIRESALLRLPHFHAGYKCSCGLQELPVCRRVARIGSGNPICCGVRLPHFYAGYKSRRSAAG